MYSLTLHSKRGRGLTLLIKHSCDHTKQKERLCLRKQKNKGNAVMSAVMSDQSGGPPRGFPGRLSVPQDAADAWRAPRRVGKLLVLRWRR